MIEMMSPADQAMAQAAVDELNRANTVYNFVRSELTRRYQLGPLDTWHVYGHIERGPASIQLEDVPRG